MLIPVSVVTAGATTTAALPVAGVAGWWSPDELGTVTLASSGRVSQINDKSGNGNHMTQATDVNRPMVIEHPTIFGTRNGLAFQAGQSMTSSLSASTRPETSFVVFWLWSNSGNPTLIGPSGDGGRQIRITSNNLQVVKSGQTVLWSTSLAPSVLAPHVVATRLTGGLDMAMWLDSQTPQTNIDSTSFTGGLTTQFAWKGTPGDPQYLNGVLGEVAIFQSSLSDGDVALMLAYLKAKWGTP